MMKWRKTLNLTLSSLFSLAILDVSATGMGSLPPLGTLLNPSTGVFTIVAGALLPRNRSIALAGLQQPAQISFTANGSAYIDAKTNADLFFAMGYLQATFRLFQMDLMRRQGEGLLSQVVGQDTLPSDQFEDTLGISRTAVKEWLTTPASSTAHQALTAFSKGVNARISFDEKTHQLPTMFKLLNYTPAPWTPVDSLVIQGDMTQTLDFSTTPIDYAILVHALGYKRAMDWFPVIAKTVQHPYDPGPYTHAAAVPISFEQSVTVGEAHAANVLAHEFEQLPKGLIHTYSNSNNWAVSGFRTASGKPLMAGDPHLNLTLPSIWYQVSGSSPSFHFSGVSVPGLPIILIGHNRSISWSLTDVQNQSTFFYHEYTNPKYPGQYLYKNRYIPFQRVRYQIPVKGKAPVSLIVQIAKQGPVLTQSGMTLAVDWMGNLPSPDLQSMLDVVRAKNFPDFQSALRNWHAPTQNFVYADRAGNIGMISAGYYPIVNTPDPWLPLPGNGTAKIVGTIPYQDIPHVYNPPSGIVFSANQRVVSANYPYYIGTSADFFSNGYRADEIYKTLHNAKHLTVKDMETLQNDTRDILAEQIVPILLHTLNGTNLPSQPAQARMILSRWNDHMSVNSAAATLWWTFWTDYLKNTFSPWWKVDHVNVNADANLAITPGNAPLDEDLQFWTMNQPTQRSHLREVRKGIPHRL
ncbi:hypothetical protein AYW79_02565 [Ferroacidibacillus organovorans]|uniref:Penicillin acylase family protein n=2 Tax=Ferroacidibacillus organovorans TaxID=1765683 RepID=A0A853KDD8_9BACL|nr:hypothetical protein AYJ22_05210 [Ferroacidibacillus organovorans]OAG94897.1 hypothetical protein AYW79_02565 [Ferroacidibacillus organovorans]